MHIVKLISSFALFSWQRDKKNKESALVKCPLFPIFSKFCKQSKCHSKFKVGNSLQIVLIGPSINKAVLKFGVFDPLHSGGGFECNQSKLQLKFIFQVKLVPYPNLCLELFPTELQKLSSRKH